MWKVSVCTLPLVDGTPSMIRRCGTTMPSKYFESDFCRIELIQWQLPRPVTVPFVSFCAHCLKSLLMLSVKVVVALSLNVPVAVTLYWAISVVEIWKLVVKDPVLSVVALVLRLHVLPTLSFTKIEMASFGCQLTPASVTVEPGT